MEFDYNKKYNIKDLLEIFELPLFVRKETWTNDFCFKILSVDNSLNGTTYKGGQISISDSKGLEFETVYVYMPDQNTDDPLTINKKYVAYTRALSSLTVLS